MVFNRYGLTGFYKDLGTIIGIVQTLGIIDARTWIQLNLTLSFIRLFEKILTLVFYSNMM